MATKNPRLQVVLEPALYKAIEELAEHAGVSMSTMARDLIKEALEHMEDVVLAEMVEERARKPGKLISMQEMRKRLGV